MKRGVGVDVLNEQKNIAKKLAILGRYGNQPYDVAAKMPLGRMNRYLEGLAELIEDEKKSIKP